MTESFLIKNNVLLLSVTQRQYPVTNVDTKRNTRQKLYYKNIKSHEKFISK